MDRPVGKGVSLDFSPTYRGAQPQGKDGACVTLASEDANKENERSSGPVLSLVQFSRAPFVSFEAVKLGTSRAAVLVIDNPNDHVTEIRVDKIPAEKGFSVDQMHFSLNPDESTCLTVRWTPVEEGGVRELLTFIANGIVKHQAILLGRAESHKKKKRSLWESIKTKKPAGRPVTVKGRKTESTLNKTVNRTFHVSRKVQYLKEKARSPLQSLNDKPVLGNRTPVKANPMDFFAPEQNNAPGSLPRSKTYSVLNKSSSDDSFQACEPVLSPAVLDGVSDSPFQETVSVSFCNVTKVVRELNRTHSPVNTPDRVINPLTPQIHSRHVSGSFVSSSVGYESCTSSVTSVLSIQDALEIIQSDVAYPSESRAVSPAASSSFDGTDSLDSLKDDDDEDAGSLRIPTVALPEFSSDLEPAKSRLTFFVSSKPVPETNVQVPAESKPAFTSATVTKSKSCPVQEGTSRPAKKGASRRRLLGKTMGLSEGDSDKARFGRMTAVALCGLPVIDSDVSLEASLGSDWIQSPRVPRHMVASPKLTFPDISPLSLSPSGTPVLATQPDLSPIVAVQPTGSSLSTWNDLMLVTSQLDLCPVSSEQPDKSPLVEPPPLPVVFAPTELRNKKRKSGEFLKENSVQVGQTLHVKRSRTSRMSAGVVQDKRPISRAAAQKPRQKTAEIRTEKINLVTVIFIEGTQSSKSMVTTSLKKKKAVVGVAMSRLTFIKPIQSAIPRHPLPFAAKNMFYDERWIEKQERGFTWWINYVLTPDDFKVNTEVSKVSAVSLVMGADNPHKASVPKAPTKEEMSFRAYTARCRLNRLRRAACGLFTSEAMVKAIQRLELEIEARRLLVRKDRHLWKDIGERQKILNWLLSYNPLWLRIGLETIYGELISLESNSDVTGLAMFILSRLLWNPDIAAEYRHPKVPNLYRDGHEEALSRFTLKKLLLLVCFLDKAKESRMIDHDPCLFCMDAEFKTSKDLLLAFSRDFLSGEGILSRHLGYLGLAVSHAQTPLDEFNFAVKNLAVDLRCGIRLVRVMELFVQDWSLSRKLRVPAISRLQKIHNVEVALQVLKARGIDLKDDHGAAIDARDVVDGHREKTLALLWKIIFAFQVDILLDEKQLEEEINFLKRTWRTRQELASLRSNHGVVEKTGEGGNNDLKSGKKVDLLMEWVNAVCRFYSTKIENFTVSFSDGQVLCYLIHHYHPSYLPLDAISQHTTQTVECGQRGAVGLNCSTSDSDSSFEAVPGVQNGFATSVQFKKLLDNERKNFHLVDAAVSDLGGVPAMLNPTDMSNTIPNEKTSSYCAVKNFQRLKRYTVVLQACVRMKIAVAAYKKVLWAVTTIQRCQKARQMGKEGHQKYLTLRHSAIVIQRGFRRWKAQALIKANEAATVIQAAFRKWEQRKMARRNQAALRIQAWYRMHKCQRQAAKLGNLQRTEYQKKRRACICLQAAVRGYVQRRSLQMQKKAAVKIQSSFRAYKERMCYLKKCKAAVVIQKYYRTYKESVLCRRRFLKLKAAAVCLQASYRGYRFRRSIKCQHESAIVIQTAFRAHVQRQKFAKMRQSSILIQRWFRACKVSHQDREGYVKMRSAAIVLQAAYRGYMVRKEMLKRHRATTLIQAAYRMFVNRRRFFSLKRAAVAVQRQFKAKREGEQQRQKYKRLCSLVVKLQALWRGYTLRKQVGKWHQAAVVIQSFYRMHQAQSTFVSKKRAALVVQNRYRAYCSGKKQLSRYLEIRRAALTLQAATYRGFKVRRDLRSMHKAATVIQAKFRMHKAKIAYCAMRVAAIIIQQHYRAYVMGVQEHKRYLLIKSSAVVIQSAYSGMKVRVQLQKMHRAATVIQAHYRKQKQLARFRRLCWAARVVQQRYRAAKRRDAEVQNYRAIKNAAICLQSAIRGIQARRNLKKMQSAARIIQRRYAAYTQRMRYLSTKAAAVTVQRWYRALIVARQQQKQYHSMRSAAITLQAGYRGMIVRREMQRKIRAATVIQASFRKYRTRVPFKALRKLLWAAAVVQKRYRACRVRDVDVQQYRSMKMAAVVIQSTFRGFKARQQIKKMHTAASVIQWKFKAFRENRRFLSIQAATVLVQQKYRALIAARTQRKIYLLQRSAAITIQSAYRGMKARSAIGKQHQAATVIQAAFRMHRCRIPFKAMKLAATLLQRRYRAYVRGRNERLAFSKLHRSALLIQAAYRGREVRRELQAKHNAAAVIQAQVRMQLRKSHYKRLQWAAKVVQQQYRANKMRDVDMKSFNLKKHAAIVIQSASRGMKSRRHLRNMHKAAIVIQSTFKAYSTRNKYLALKASVSAIQLRYRALIVAKRQKEHDLSLRRAAVTIQAAFRGNRVRKEIGQKHVAATVIQAAFRSHREMVKFQAMKLSALIIQMHYKAYLQVKTEREKYLRLRRSALTIQAAFRGQSVRQTLLRSHKAAVVIQSSYRMHRQRMVFKKLCGATKVLQQRFRAKRLRDFEEQWYRSLKKAVVCLQAAFRAKRARRLATQIRAARKIQSFLKMRVKQRHFLQQKAASIVIQTAFRSYRARIGYAAMQESAIVIQRWFRFCKVAREQKAQFTAIKQATVTLQCAFRGMMARKMARRKRAAVKVQSVLRMVVCRRRFLMLRSATVVLQAHYRIFATKRQFRSYVTAARTLQKHYRAYQARRQQRAIYLETLKCIRKLQARIRGFNELRRFQTIKKSAVTIQAFYRGVVQRRKFLQWKASATTIQTHFRAHLLRQKERAKYLEMKKSAVTLQTMMRGYLSRRLLKRIRVALKIQAWYRGAIMRRDFRARQRAIATVGHYVRARLIRKRFLLIRQAVHILQTRWRETLHARKERNKFLQMKSSCVKIQALWRGYSLRETLQRMEEETRSKRRLRFSAAVYHHLCAVRIQRVFRAHLALKSAKQQIHCVISIQRWIRSKLQRKSYLEERRKIVTAQRAVHSWLSRRNKAATVIQQAVKKFLREKRLKRIHRGIVRMQALWRGHRSRLKSDTTQLVAMRRRFVKVNQEAKEEDKLCNKTTTAIDYLLRYRHFSYILAALKQLETATRLSPQCCEHLVKSGATLTIFILIRSCNRSVPCMEVITYAIQVLLNLSKYDKTTEAVYDVENSIDTLLELMQIYREKAGDKVADKGGSIFTKTCFLLVILLQDHQRALEVRKLPKVAERVCSIYRLTARKHKMDAERTVTRQKMNVSLNGSFFSQATPRKARALPRYFFFIAVVKISSGFQKLMG
ncbi:ASPM protein, partial [Amia calva]|nr:ASPM protein [Amia calva]